MAGILLILACGLCWGVAQGMVMSKEGDANAVLFDGVRYHKWFRVYHAIDALVIVLAVLVGYLLPTCKNYLQVAGALILAWEFKEVGYSLTRYNRIKKEHIVFLDLWNCYLTMKQTIFIHIARLVIGLALIAGGLLCLKN